MKVMFALVVILLTSTQSFAGHSKYYIDCSKRHGAYFFDGKTSQHLDDKLPIPALIPGKTSSITIARSKTHAVSITHYGNTFGVDLLKIKTPKTGIVMGYMAGKLFDGNRFSADLQDGRVSLSLNDCYIRAE